MIKKKFILSAAILSVVFICGCGGGFKDDSSNAAEYQKSIFGPDSIKNHFRFDQKTPNTNPSK